MMRTATHRIPAEDQRDVVGRAGTDIWSLNQIFTAKGLARARPQLSQMIAARDRAAKACYLSSGRDRTAAVRPSQ